MTITPQWKDELRARITLSTLVGRTTKLTKAGREWKACCPFHNEATPSFYVNDDKQFYHCFGCGAHGDAITWMIEQRGFGFMDAVKELAEEAGMEVPRPDPQAAQKAEKRAELVDVTSAAQDWFVDRLKGPEGREALDYLRARGFSDAILHEFGFGYAPEDKQALAKALSQFEPQMLAESGMRIVTDEGQAYDRFRGRVMLPIQDKRGRVIAFGGRILEKREGVAKYLNSPDTPLFDKGRTLYNHHRAAPASRQTGRVIVVEGYMDVVALAQAGFHDAVAPLGTALTEAQLELLWRMVEVPVLCFDGDAAGQRAAMRAMTRALPLLAPMRSLAIVRLPAGLDPDDLIKQGGPKAMEALLEGAMSLLDALWRAERDAQPLESPEAKAGLKKRLMDHADTIGDPDIRSLYRREWQNRFSAFAYPPREQRGGKFGQNRGYKPGNRQSSAWRGGNTAPQSLAPGALAVLQKFLTRSERGNLLSAVILGLARHPQEIDAHAEALSRLARLEPEAAPVIESVIELTETLDSHDQSAIFGTGGLPAPPEHLRYAFLREGHDPGEAREELAEAVSLLVQKPSLEAALSATIARFDEDPEGCFAEQTRLRAQLTAVEERLKAFGRRKAASGSADEASEGDTDKAA